MSANNNKQQQFINERCVIKMRLKIFPYNAPILKGKGEILLRKKWIFNRKYIQEYIDRWSIEIKKNV